MNSVRDAREPNFISYKEFEELSKLVGQQDTHLDNRTAKLAAKLFTAIQKKSGPLEAAGRKPISPAEMTKLGEEILVSFGRQAGEWTYAGKVLSAIKDFFISLGKVLGGENSSQQSWGISSLHQLAKHFKNNPTIIADFESQLKKAQDSLTHTPNLIDKQKTEKDIANLTTALAIIKEESDKAAELLQQPDVQEGIPTEANEKQAEGIMQRTSKALSGGITYLAFLFARISNFNQLTTYKAKIQDKIMECNTLIKSLRKSQTNSTIKCFQLFSFDLGGSTFDTYKKGHHVTFVFSLNPDCSEAVKAKQAEKHTIEVLDDKGEVLKTYARELTQESLDRMQENRLQITTDYILNFIQAVSVKYNWVPAAGTVSSFSATSDKHSSHLDGSLAVKINLPDRIGAVSKSTLEWNTLFKTIESA